MYMYTHSYMYMYGIKSSLPINYNKEKPFLLAGD